MPHDNIIGDTPTDPLYIDNAGILEVTQNRDEKDAFGRFRVSNSVTEFDGQLTYDLQPLLFDQQTSSAEATISYDSTNRCADLDFTSAVDGDYVYMQTFEFMRYQPGMGQIAFITCNFRGGAENVTKYVGYSDGTNGIELQLVGTDTVQFQLKSATGNGTQTAAWSDWNIDKLNGYGASGIKLDFTKTQIVVIDFQALYVGRVRVGFDIDGDVIYVHEFNHANRVVNPYIQTANLPVRAGMIATGDATTNMDFICCAVQSEGGREQVYSYQFSTEGTVTAGNGTDTHILSLRPRTTFNSITNRTRFNLTGIRFLNTGQNDVLYKVCVGQAITTPTVANVNTTYSTVDKLTGGTLSGTPALVLDQGYVLAGAGQSSGALQNAQQLKLPLTLDATGAVRDLGTLTVLVQGIGGNSAMRCELTWEEIR